MKVTVGSQNPTKIKAVKEVLSKIYTEQVQVIPKQVESGVSEQPMGELETINGAVNRAKNCLESEDLGIGIEGGIHKNKYGYFLRAWVAIWDGTTLGLGGGSSLQLPKYLIKQMKTEKKELGNIMNTLMNRTNIPEKEGAFGIFTDQLLPRKESFYHALIVSLAPFLRENLYKPNK